MKNETVCRLSELRPPLEYIPVRHDSTRGLSMSNMPGESVRLEEDTPGPLMNFILSMGEFFTLAAVFAAFSLMLMVAGA